MVLAITIFVLIASAVAVPIIGNHISNLEDHKNTQANALLTESWEAVRAIRNNNWASITNGAHGLQNTNDYWEFYGSSDTFNGFTRIITVSNVRRDANGNRVESGGTVDDDSKQIDIQLTWNPTPYDSRSLSTESLITNYVNPGVWPPL